MNTVTHSRSHTTVVMLTFTMVLLAVMSDANTISTPSPLSSVKAKVSSSSSPFGIIHNHHAIILNIRGGGRSYDDSDSSDYEESESESESEYDDESEEEEEVVAVVAPPKRKSKLSKSAVLAAKKAKSKKTSASKKALSQSLSSSSSSTKKKKVPVKAAAAAPVRKSRGGITKKIPYIIRAFMNPFTVLAMTKGYFASLFNIDYLQEDVSQTLRSALEEKAKQTGGGPKPKPRGRKMRPGQAKTLSDLPVINA
jgi:hypothetical protein